MQSEITALQGAILDFITNLKQEFEQIRIFKLNNYITQLSLVQIE